jgi:hypothetical protein
MGDEFDPDLIRLTAMLAADFELYLRLERTSEQLHATARDLLRHLHSLDSQPESAVKLIKEAVIARRLDSPHAVSITGEPLRDRLAARDELVRWCIAEYFAQGNDRLQQPRLEA